MGGHVIEIGGKMGSGKTLTAVLAAVKALKSEVLSPSNLFTNIKFLNYPVALYEHSGMFDLISNIVSFDSPFLTQDGYKLIIWDEMDTAANKRYFNQKNQTAMLQGLYMLRKLNCDFIGITHDSGAIDKIYRQMVNIYVEPALDTKKDQLTCYIANEDTGTYYKNIIDRPSAYYDEFNSYQVLG